MGKQGELWDDSALIKAFDSAISKFKVMHGKSGEKAIMDTEENLPGTGADNESIAHGSNTEFVQNDDSLLNGLETTTKVAETAESLVSTEDSSAKCVALPNTQERHVPPTNDISATTSVSQGEHTVLTDLKDQNEAEAACYLNGSEEYSKLLSKYYEVENQRQHILQQLNEYSNWNNQYPVTSTSAAEEYQASVQQPYEAVACNCAYGCQNWVAQCDSTPAASSGSKYIDTTCHAKGSPNGNSRPKQEPDFVKMAMAAAEKALSLTTQANGGTRNQLGIETQSATDLDMVLSAWYSAGFYTGKYVSEQSSDRSKQGGGV